MAAARVGGHTLPVCALALNSAGGNPGTVIAPSW